jgi:hypothetical protein
VHCVGYFYYHLNAVHHKSKTDCSEIEPRSLWRETGGSAPDELSTSSNIELQTQIMWLQWSISSEENGPLYMAWSLKRFSVPLIFPRIYGQTL